MTRFFMLCALPDAGAAKKNKYRQDIGPNMKPVQSSGKNTSAMVPVGRLSFRRNVALLAFASSEVIKSPRPVPFDLRVSS
jgi:hypothetical protein